MPTVRTLVIDRGWNRTKRDALGLNGRAVKVGILANAGSQDGVPVVAYATFNEFGTERIPARPFMRKTADEAEAAVRGFVSAMVEGVMAGLVRQDQVLDRLGLWYQARIRKTIRDARNWAVPNAPSTVARKGSTSPLIDSGMMMGAVNYEKGRL